MVDANPERVHCYADNSLMFQFCAIDRARLPRFCRGDHEYLEEVHQLLCCICGIA